MSSTCEKCWRDAGRMAYGEPSKGQVVIYAELVARRVGPLVCTPEQQAGEDAGECPMCKRRTLHQHTSDCMNDECEASRPRAAKGET